MEFLIKDEYSHIIKRAGKEIYFLNKGDCVIVNDTIYIVDNKHLDYDENEFSVYTEKEE